MRVVAADAWADAAEVQHEYDLPLYPADAVQGVDALVVAVGHHEYRDMTPEQLKALTRGNRPVLADVKSLYNRHALAKAGFQVFRL